MADHPEAESHALDSMSTASRRARYQHQEAQDELLRHLEADSATCAGRSQNKH